MIPILALFLVVGLPTLLTYFLVRRNKIEYLELPNGKRYAGLWDRFLAGIIDNIFLLIIGFFLSTVLSQTQVMGGGFWITFFYYVLWRKFITTQFIFVNRKKSARKILGCKAHFHFNTIKLGCPC